LHDIAKPQTFSIENGQPHFYQHEHIGAGIAAAILERMKAPIKFTKHVELLVKHHMRLHQQASPMTNKGMRRLFYSLGMRVDIMTDLLDLNLADITSTKDYIVKALRAYNEQMRKLARIVIDEMTNAPPKLPKGFGNELAELGIPKSKVMGDIMEELTNRLVNGDIEYDKDILLKEASQIYKEYTK